MLILHQIEIIYAAKIRYIFRFCKYLSFNNVNVLQEHKLSQPSYIYVIPIQECYMLPYSGEKVSPRQVSVPKTYTVPVPRECLDTAFAQFVATTHPRVPTFPTCLVWRAPLPPPQPVRQVLFLYLRAVWFACFTLNSADLCVFKCDINCEDN